MNIITFSFLIFVALSLTGCGNKIDKINGAYDLEVGNQVCHMLDLKSITINSDKLIVTGGGSTKMIDTFASMSGSSSNQILMAKENNRKHSEGITTYFKKVEVKDVLITKGEWDKNSLNSTDTLFTKIYTLTLENGKQIEVYSDEKNRVAIAYYDKCIFRR